MKFASMLRRLRNTQGGGTGSTPGSGSESTDQGASQPGPYNATLVPPLQGPYDAVPVPPVDPPPPDTRPPRVYILVSPGVAFGPFEVVFAWSEPVTDFTQDKVRIEGISKKVNSFEEDENQPGKRYIMNITPTHIQGGDIRFIVRKNQVQDAAGNWNNEDAEATTTVAPDTYTFTNLPPGTPTPTYPPPIGVGVDRFPTDQDPPPPPDYAVLVDPPIPATPALQVQGERKLSDFEKAVASVVFGNSPSFTDEVYKNELKIKHDLGTTGGGAGSYGNGLITMNNIKFPFTPNLTASSDVDDFDASELNSVGMLQYIWTLSHEMAHWWQDDQNRHDHKWPAGGFQTYEQNYEFNEAQLQAHKFVDKEAHASAVATAAVIAWQLEHRPEGQLINITSPLNRDGYENAGKVHRYMKIRGMEYQTPGFGRHTTSPPVGNWITRQEAQELLADFNTVLTEVRTAEPLPEPEEE